MEIREYFSLDAAERARMREAIRLADWRAAAFLYKLLEEDTLRECCGPNTRLLLGMEGERLAAFCTLADRDEIVDTPLTPWIGFVYTFPAFRGQRRSGALIERACALARAAGHTHVYVSTNEIGLYEKYGFAFSHADRDAWGGETRVYVKAFSQ